VSQQVAVEASHSALRCAALPELNEAHNRCDFTKAHGRQRKRKRGDGTKNLLNNEGSEVKTFIGETGGKT